MTRLPILGLWATPGEGLQRLLLSILLDRAQHVPAVRTSSSPSVGLLGPLPPSSPRAAAGSPGRDARRGPGSFRPWPLEGAAPSPGADARLDESDVDCRCPCSAKLHLGLSIDFHVIAMALPWRSISNRAHSRDARGLRSGHSWRVPHESRALSWRWLLPARCHWGWTNGAQSVQVLALSWA